VVTSAKIMSMAVFTLQQSTAVVNNNEYQVTNTITQAVGCDTGVFVFITATQCFSHYATVADVTQWSTNLEVAQLLNQPFYRLSTVTRTWKTAIEMTEDLSYTTFRVQSLADELTEFSGDLTTNTTTVITGS
jgi:hypothetical protein